MSSTEDVCARVVEDGDVSAVFSLERVPAVFVVVGIVGVGTVDADIARDCSGNDDDEVDDDKLQVAISASSSSSCVEVHPLSLSSLQSPFGDFGSGTGRFASIL